MLFCHSALLLLFPPKHLVHLSARQPVHLPTCSLANLSDNSVLFTQYPPFPIAYLFFFINFACVEK